MNPIQDVLWKYFQGELNQALNHEASRSSITNLILIITGVIITIITYDQQINNSDLTLSIFPMLIGLFGIVSNAKYYERFHFHYSRAKGYRKSLEEQFPNFDFSALRANSDLESAKQFKRISKVRLNWLWMILNLLISIFGLVLTLKIICS